MRFSVTRKVDELGRIVIPSDFREALHLQSGSRLEIYMEGERIVMNDHFDKELDFFSIGVIDAHTYISERLKNAVEANGLMGWVFTPTTKLVVE